MPTKNKSYFNQLAEVAHKPIVTAKIDRLVNSPNTHIKAYATVNLGGAFVVHDVKIVDGQKGLFVQMPQTTFLLAVAGATLVLALKTRKPHKKKV